jgi:hypothetical protein
MKFMAISEATQHLQGKFIGFIGDRTPTREPMAVLFPAQMMWQWVKATVANHGPSLLEHYDTNPSRCGSLWTPAVDCPKGERNIPHLLHIPLVLFELIRN